MICTFPFAPFFTRAQSLAAADSLFEEGRYLEARVAYEYLLFQRPGASDRVNLLLLKKAYCFKAEGLYNEAYETLQQADFFAGSDSLKQTLYYEVALAAYVSGQHDVALSRLQEMFYYFPDHNLPMAFLLEILCLNQLQRWDDAAKRYQQLQTRLHLAGDNPYKGRRIKPKNPDRAETWSYVLPGSGQVYAGYGARGFSSLLLQSACAAFATYSFLNGFYFSGAFTGVSLFYMFYNGGARYARSLTEKTNAKRLNALNEAVLKSAQELKK